MSWTIAILLGLARLLTLLAPGEGPGSDKSACAAEADVLPAAQRVTEHFTRLNGHEYLIEYLAESRNGFPFGGRLTVHLLNRDTGGWEDPDGMVIMDRRAPDPTDWHSVSNLGWIGPRGSAIGCVEYPARPLTLEPVADPTLAESQVRFNDLIRMILERSSPDQGTAPYPM